MGIEMLGPNVQNLLCAAEGADRRRAVGDGLWAFVTNSPHALQWPRQTARRRFAVRPTRWAPARLPVHQTTSLSNARQLSNPVCCLKADCRSMWSCVD